MRRISLIILSILLIHTSPVSAGVGDVYYCTSKAHVEIENFIVRPIILEKFTFKRTSQGLFFGKGGGKSGVELKKRQFDVGVETFTWTNGDNLIFNYDEGQFNYAQATYDYVSAQQGTCEVFE